MVKKTSKGTVSPQTCVSITAFPGDAAQVLHSCTCITSEVENHLSFLGVGKGRICGKHAVLFVYHTAILKMDFKVYL